MVHYYAALAVPVPFVLSATVATGVRHDGSDLHLLLGLFSAIYCVAVHTLLILFMIVTGRILKAAMQARPLAPDFLRELNQFFARKRAYPLCLLAATLTVAAAVLGHGRFIGVPSTVHVVLGAATLPANLLVILAGLRVLRANQLLVDRVAAELDRLDRTAPGTAAAAEAPLAFGPRARWLVFALAAWAPYLYWGLVVWRGRFEEVGLALPAACALLSLVGLLRAWRVRRAG
jgi:hypothetical protein